MRRTLVTCALIGLSAACGGVNTTIDGDGGGDDSGNNVDSSNPSDGGNGGDAVSTNDAADAAPFDVKSVVGLALWLKGDVGVAADGAKHVSVWSDQSGNGNDAKENRDGIEP